MSSPINRQLGGRYGALARMGVDITPNAVPNSVGWTFNGPVAFNDATPMQANGSDIPLLQQGPLLSGDTAGALFSWVNPWAYPILITAFWLEVTTVNTTGACTVDVGIAANATTSDDEIIDGQDVQSATGIFASTLVPIRLDEAGGTQDTITVSKATGATAGLEGRVYFTYVPIQ